MSETPARKPEEVLRFWFSLERPGRKDDARVRAVLGGAYERAAGGELDDWAAAPRSRLALVLLLDQVPRHLYRRDARAYATDLKAQEVARPFVEQRDFGNLQPLERFYALLPWLHAESAERQAAVNPLMHEVAPQVPGLAFMTRCADLYRDTIGRWGYFPHRNTLRGVPMSDEEQRFLDEEFFPRRRAFLPADRLAEERDGTPANPAEHNLPPERGAR